MSICEICLFDWYFAQFCKSDMSKYGHLEVFQRIPSTSRYRESTVTVLLLNGVVNRRTIKQQIFSLPLIAVLRATIAFSGISGRERNG